MRFSRDIYKHNANCCYQNASKAFFWLSSAIRITAVETSNCYSCVKVDFWDSKTTDNISYLLQNKPCAFFKTFRPSLFVSSFQILPFLKAKFLDSQESIPCKEALKTKRIIYHSVKPSTPRANNCQLYDIFLFRINFRHF